MRDEAISPSDSELDLQEFASESQVPESASLSVGATPNPLANATDDVDAGDTNLSAKPKKGGSMKIFWIGLGVMVLVFGGLIGVTALNAKAGNATTANPKLDFQSGTQTTQESPPQLVQTAGISKKEYQELLQKVNDLEQSQLNIKQGVESTNEMVLKKFNQQDSYFAEIKVMLQDHDKLINTLDNTGATKFIDQEKRIENFELKMDKKLASEFKQMRIQLAAEKKAREESKRANYEVVSVIKDRIRLVDIDTRKEMTKSKGDMLEGYGRIQSVDIYGCIKFQNGSLYSPINARCVK
ncbi:hypothetical protein [Shewanella colwelliana]|uniref:hypothetical protein n=1 Tax=Shewanella colwelliana TaxID=23 RepID=UPI0022AFF476|nr:hypothetical protein [Shewanella colwelliana]MCZ4337776.1 hypothetical protein [Shewanella colwelliana]